MTGIIWHRLPMIIGMAISEGDGLAVGAKRLVAIGNTRRKARANTERIEYVADTRF